MKAKKKNDFWFCFLIKTTIENQFMRSTDIVSIPNSNLLRVNLWYEHQQSRDVCTMIINKINEILVNEEASMRYIRNDIIFLICLFRMMIRIPSFDIVFTKMFFNSTFISDWYNNRQKKNCSVRFVLNYRFIYHYKLQYKILLHHYCGLLGWANEIGPDSQYLSLLFFLYYFVVHEKFLCIFVCVVSVGDLLLRLNILINGIVFRLLMCSYLSHRKNRFYC